MGNLSDIPKEIQAAAYQGGVLPKGKYLCELKNSELKATNKGDGKYLKLDFVICDGSDFDGQHIFGNLNVINSNPVAQQIGQGLLGQLAKSVGFLVIPDESFELHDRKVLVEVKIQASTNPAYPEDKNQIVAFHEYKLGSVVVKKKNEKTTPIQDAGFDSDEIGF